MCEEEESVVECVECSKFLCENCSKKHKEKKNHNFKEISNVYLCTDHQMKCEFYCYYCHETVCPNCVHPLLNDSKHSKHKVETLEECEKNTIKKSNDYISNMDSKISLQKKKILEIKSKINQLEEKLKDKKIEFQDNLKLVDKLFKNMNDFKQLNFLDQLKIMEFQYKGIYKNEIKISELLKEGWVVVFEQGYEDVFEISDLGSVSNGFYCVGGFQNDNDVIDLCAFGSESIFSKTDSSIKAVLINGVYWYCVEGESFGFSDKEEIHLDSADTMIGDLRLSWHLGSSGYRIGSLLNLDSNFSKIILKKVK
jgi:hypothetical protein